MVTELLERDAYFAMLEVALAEAATGNGRIALVSGEAGIGKTSLVEQFTAIYRNKMHVLWGACDLLFTPRPLGPLHDMAPQTQGDLPHLLASEAGLATIFPAFLGELQRRSVIVVFEDVHWADEATLDLLRFIGRRIGHAHALLVVTYRDDELGPRHPLRSVLGDLIASPAVRRITLPPLSEQAVRTLVGQREVDVPTLYRLTRGNPFFLTEVLANETADIPASVRDAVLARAARLSASAYAVLEAASVIGSHCEPWVLAEVVGSEVRCVEECLTAGMLVDQEGVLAFRHELERKTILEALSSPRKIALHRNTLQALQASTAQQADLSRLAHHAEAAGDRQAVMAYAPAAARQASAANAHRESADLYTLALRFGDEFQPDAHARLLEAYAQECNLIDRRPDGIQAYKKALAIWRKIGEPLRQGENLARTALTLNGLGKMDDAQKASRTAIEILEAQPPSRELALAYRTQAGLHMLNHDYHASIEWAEKAIGLAERFEDTVTIMEARNTIGTCWLHLDYEYGCRYMEQSLAEAQDAGLEMLAAHTYTNLSSVSNQIYRFSQAERYTSEGMAYATERNLERLRLYMLAWQSVGLLHQGRWSEAADAADEVLRHRGVSVTSQVTALVTLGCLRTRRGDPNASAALDEALELSREIGSIHRVALVRAARAEAAWQANDCQRTLEEACAAYDLALDKKHPWFAGELAFWRWKAGDHVECPDWLAEPFALQIAGSWQAAADEWERLGCPYEQESALADGGIEARTAALRLFEELGARPAADALRRQLLASGATGIPRKPRASTQKNPFGLTGRQVEILALLAENLTNEEIAARLHISPKTADHHVSAILARLDVRSRREAAALAGRHPHFEEE